MSRHARHLQFRQQKIVYEVMTDEPPCLVCTRVFHLLCSFSVSAFGNGAHADGHGGVTADLVDDADRVAASPLRRKRGNEGRTERGSCVNHSNKLISAIWPSRQTATPRRKSRLFCRHRRHRRCRLSRKMEGPEVQTWRRSRSTREWTSGARGASTRGTERHEGIAEGESVNARPTYAK